MSNIRKIARAETILSRTSKIVFFLYFLVLNFIGCQNYQKENESLELIYENFLHDDKLDTKTSNNIGYTNWLSIWQLCQEQDHRWEKERWELASQYKQAMYENQHPAPWYFLAGRLLGLCGKIEESRILFQKAVAKEENDIWGYYGLGMYFLKKNNVFYAEIYFNYCLKLVPNFIPGFIGLAKLAEINRNDRNLSQQYLEQGIRVSPHHALSAELHQHLGNLLGIPNGIIHLEKAYQFAPKNIRVLHDLGMAYIKAKEYSKAIHIFQKLQPLLSSQEQREKIEILLKRLENQKMVD